MPDRLPEPWASSASVAAGSRSRSRAPRVKRSALTFVHARAAVLPPLYGGLRNEKDVTVTVTPRLLIAATLASATLGGAVGALATAATTSQANPQAIAAAVGRVQDQAADRALRLIAIDMITVEGDLKAIREDSGNARVNLFNICWNTGSTLQRPSCER
jgi:hypothetical protein